MTLYNWRIVYVPMGTIFTKKINPDEGPAEAAATTAAEVAAPTAAGSSCDAAGSSCEAAAAGPQVDEVAAPSPDRAEGTWVFPGPTRLGKIKNLNVAIYMLVSKTLNPKWLTRYLKFYLTDSFKIS
ncbi:uncharacterized protein LOC125500950 isoform X2 [Athalia rosae]|uniref:uncharacterized protein LOC125500950 isoform X2 n=1 Tax=Athalia rosae TaxID=37344 RepID=UPI0020348D53|nr:uncharacterized protein LOC125500950 isoform X2 [Athalia rosae]